MASSSPILNNVETHSLSGGRAAAFGEVILSGARVDGHLILRDAAFGEVILNVARVDGHLVLDKATVTGLLNMNSLQVGQDLSMSGTQAPATFQEVILTVAKVDGHLVLSGAKVEGLLNMNGLQVGQTLSMRGTQAPAINLGFAHITRNLDLSGAELKSFDLSAARIEGELGMGSSGDSATLWAEKDAHINLHNAHVGILQDWAALDREAKYWRSSWPNDASLQLDGFTYDRLGRFDPRANQEIEAGEEMLHERPVTWYLNWLRRDETFSPQPYEYLAATFRKAGEADKADDVLYASRERVREQAKPRLRWWGLSLLKYTISYGIGSGYFFLPLFWVVGLAIASTIILFAAGQPVTCDIVDQPSGCLSNRLADSSMAARFVYSLGQVLPIVELDPAHKNVQLTGWVWLWFVLLVRPFGYVLAGAIVAGMAGLTQK